MSDDEDRERPDDAEDAGSDAAGSDAAEKPDAADEKADAAGAKSAADDEGSGEAKSASGDKPSRRRRRKRPAGETTAAPQPAATAAKLDPGSKAKAKSRSKPKASTAGDGDGTAADGDGKDRMDLPKWNRARVKRKQVAGEEQDAFQASVRKAGKQAIQRAPVVLGLIVLVAAGIATFVWWQGRQEENAAEATRILAEAAAVQARGQVTDVEAFKEQRKLPPPLPLLSEEAERVQRAEKALAELTSAAEGSEADTIGQLLRAAQAVKDGKFTDAVAAYDAFLGEHASHELSFLAREGRALALEASGDVDGALAELETLAGKTGDFYRDQALWHKGRMLESQERGDEALEVYKLYVEEFPLDKDSIAKPKIVARLKELQPDLVPADAEAPGGLGGLGGLALPPGLGQ